MSPCRLLSYRAVALLRAVGRPRAQSRNEFSHHDNPHFPIAATSTKLAVHATLRNVRDFTADQFRIDSLVGMAVTYELSDWKDKMPWLVGFTAIPGYRENRVFGVTSQTVSFQIKSAIDF